MGRLSTLTRFTAATLMLAAGASQAAITVYTDQAAFLAAVSAPGVDTYLGFSITGSTPSPINRAAGPYNYTGTVTTTSFFGAGTVADPWLSTNTATDTITFNAFPPEVFAAGGLFFRRNVSGAASRAGKSASTPRRRSPAPPGPASAASYRTSR